MDSDSECSRIYYSEFQGTAPETNEPMLRLVVPIHDIRGKHLIVKYSDEIKFAKVNKFLSDFMMGKGNIDLDIKSKKVTKKFKKKYSNLDHLTGQNYFKKMKENKKLGIDSVVFMYRSNLKKDLVSLKKFNSLSKQMKKLKDSDVKFYAYDVIHNAEMNFRNRKNSLPGLNLYRSDYDLNRNTTLTKANREKEVLLFLNDRLKKDYSNFFISMSH